MAVICNDIAINNDNIEFDTEYFLHSLNVLNRKQNISDVELQGFADNLISSGNEVLMYIGKCIKWDLSIAKGAPPRPNKISVGLKEHFIKDIHHDFSVEPTRCYPKIIRCLQGPTPPYHSIDAYASFQAIKVSYNIHDMSTYNLKAEYYIEDTNSTVIKNKLNMSEKPIKKMNLIANILDSAGCKYCCEDHHYNTINLEIELYILNLGFIFYQSYFKQLRDNGIHIHFTISLMDEKETKKSFSENKIFKLCLYAKRGAYTAIKEFVLSNNRNFSVANVCKTLNSKVITGLSKELKEYLREVLEIDEERSYKILTTTYVSGKGFGDFGQVFSVACLYYCCRYFQGNCILTTIDTFLFIIAIILGCPIIIGTGRFAYISIDDFLKYKGKTIMQAHNMYSNPQIFRDDSSPDLPDIREIMSSLNGEIKSIAPNIADISGGGNMSVGMAQIPRYNSQGAQQQSSDVSMSQKSKGAKSKPKPKPKPKDELTLTPIQASFLFNVFTKRSLQYCYELNKLIYISCTSEGAQSYYVLKEKSSDGQKWIQLLKYDTYFDNKLFSERYEDNPRGRELLKTVSSHTLYTQYCNFKNFIDYISHNYDINVAGTFLEHILDSLKKGIKNIIHGQTKNNIFFVLNILLETADEVKNANAQFYERLKNPEFLARMKAEMSIPNSQNPEFLAFKAEVLSKWNIGCMLDPLKATSLLKNIKEVSEFINSCDPRYNVAYTFIGDIQAVIKNLEKIVNIIMTTIANIKSGQDTFENLITFINLFNLYKRYLLANCFNIQVEKLKSIIDDDITKLNAIISKSWEECDCQRAFEKRFNEQEGEQEQGSKKIKIADLEKKKNYFFKDSAIASKTLDEADKIYRKMGKLLLPNVLSMKDHPIAESFWCCLIAFKDLNCKFASLKSYSEQYIILKNNIEIIKLTMAKLSPLLTPDTPDVLVDAERWFGSIHKVFQDINDGIVAVAEQQAVAQQQQAIVQQQPSSSQSNKRKLTGGDIINSIINKIIEGDNISEQYSDNINIGDGCSTEQCDNICNSMNYDCRQSGNCSESAGPGASRRPPQPPRPPQQASIQASQRQSQRPSRQASQQPPQGISRGTSQRPPQGISLGISLRPSRGTSLRPSQRPPQGISLGTSLRPSQGTSRGTPRGISRGISRGTPRGTPPGISQGISRQPSQRPSHRPSHRPLQQASQRPSRRGGAIKLKENKKIILGKERCIYTKEGTKKEYIKYKNEYIGLKEFIKLKSKTTKKTQTEPKATKATKATTKKTQATTKKTQAEPKATKATTTNTKKKKI